MNVLTWLALGLAVVMPEASSPVLAGQPSESAAEALSSSLRLVSRTTSAEAPGFYNALYVERRGTAMRSEERVSLNNGREWKVASMKPDFTSALPWTFDDGQPFFSPSSMSALFRHSNGRCFWAGNLSERNCQGNSPRWPLVIAEVDPQSLRLIRSSLLTVDTEGPEDKSQGRLNISHLTLIEDRETRETILVYPRSHNAYKSREWALIRLAVK
jgi:hypothetical protein